MEPPQIQDRAVWPRVQTWVMFTNWISATRPHKDRSGQNGSSNVSICCGRCCRQGTATGTAVPSPVTTLQPSSGNCVFRRSHTHLKRLYFSCCHKVVLFCSQGTLRACDHYQHLATGQNLPPLLLLSQSSPPLCSWRIQALPTSSPSVCTNHQPWGQGMESFTRKPTCQMWLVVSLVQAVLLVSPLFLWAQFCIALKNLSLPIFPGVTLSFLVCCAALRGLAPRIRDCTSPECCLWLSHPTWQENDAEVQVVLHFVLVLVKLGWGISSFFQTLQADRRWEKPGGKEKTRGPPCERSARTGGE